MRRGLSSDVVTLSGGLDRVEVGVQKRREREERRELRCPRRSGRGHCFTVWTGQDGQVNKEAMATTCYVVVSAAGAQHHSPRIDLSRA